MAGTSKRGGTIRTLDALASALGLELILVTKEEAENMRLARVLRDLTVTVELLGEKEERDD